LSVLSIDCDKLRLLGERCCSLSFAERNRREACLRHFNNLCEGSAGVWPCFCISDGPAKNSN